VTQDRAAIIARLRQMLNRLASDLGNDASAIGEEDLIPEAGVVDSAGLIDFVMQIDAAYRLEIEAEDMTIDNFGTLDSIAAFVAAREHKRK